MAYRVKKGLDRIIRVLCRVVKGYVYGKRVVQEDALKLGPSIHKAWAVPQTPNSVYWGLGSVKPYITPI